MSGLKDMGRYGTVGLELIISMLVGLFGGQWLDKKFGTSYLIWIGFVVGTYAGFRALLKASQAIQRANEKEDRENPQVYARYDDEPLSDDDSYGAGASRQHDAPGEVYREPTEEEIAALDKEVRGELETEDTPDSEKQNGKDGPS